MSKEKKSIIYEIIREIVFLFKKCTQVNCRKIWKTKKRVKNEIAIIHNAKTHK